MIFIGDTHGIRPLFKVVDKHKIQNCNVIQVGDLGLGFQEITRDVSDLLVLDEMLVENNIQLYAIRGNHDNPMFWNKDVGLNLPKFHNLKLVEDFSVLNIEGKNVLFVGGAISIDRSIRMHDKPYPTWWRGEFFSYNYHLLRENLSKIKDLDIVVTHTAPNFVHPTDNNVDIVNHYNAIELAQGGDLKYELEDERAEVTEMYEDLTKDLNKEPKHWIYGHFHSSWKSKVNNTLFKLLNINEVYEIK
jgi:DNA repair exonuclease SbcCD nuclease subunit